MIQNVKKGRRFCRSVGRPDRPADRIWPATVFFSFYNSKWSKTWKKRSPVLPTGRSGPSGGPNLTGDRFFHLLDHLELIWKFFFQPKSFDQKKPFNWIFDIMRLILGQKFWLKNFFPNRLQMIQNVKKHEKKIAGKIAGFAGRTVRRTEFDHFSR